MADDSARKLAGILYLDLNELRANVEQANKLLNGIGKNASFDGITKNLSVQLKKASEEAAGEVDLSKLGSDGTKTTKAKAESEVSAALKQQLTYLTQLNSIEKQLVTASGDQKEKLEQAKGIYTHLVSDASDLVASAKSRVTDESSLQKIAEQEQILKAKILVQQAGIAKAVQQAEKAQKGHNIAAQAMQRISATIVTSLTQMAVQMTVGAVKQFWADGWEYATKYYDKLNEIQIVTDKSTDQAQEMGQRFRSLAQEMSVSSNEIAEAAIVFYRQGLGDDEVQSRLIATTQYAKTTGMAFDQAADMITASVNTIAKDANGMEMTAQRVADVFLYLGDNAATSGEEIGRAMSRSAALADAAGVSFEMLGAYIATVSERTRQDAVTKRRIENFSSQSMLLAGAEGLEPSTKVLETHVLPLHHTPKAENTIPLRPHCVKS